LNSEEATTRRLKDRAIPSFAPTPEDLTWQVNPYPQRAMRWFEVI
jgi:hypothetical protein